MSMVRSAYFTEAGYVSSKVLEKFGSYKFYVENILEYADFLLNAPYDLALKTEVSQSVRCHRYDGAMSNSSISSPVALYNTRTRVFEIRHSELLAMEELVDIEELTSVYAEKGISVVVK